MVDLFLMEAYFFVCVFTFYDDQNTEKDIGIAVYQWT